MAHFALIRADVGAWAVATVVDPAEFWALDEGRFKSINGDDGGTWNPAAFVSIGGAGVQLTGVNHSITGAITVGNGAQLILAGGSTIQVQSGAEVQHILGGASRWYGGSAAIFEATALLNINLGAVLSVDGTCNAENGGSFVGKNGSAFTLDAGCTVSIEADVALGSILTADAGSSVVLNGANTIAGATVTAPLVCTTDGEFRERALQTITDGDASYGVADATIISMADGHLTVGRTWTIVTAGAGNGSSMTLMNQDNTHTIYVVAGGVTYPLLNSSGYNKSIVLKMVNATWQAAAAYAVP